MPVRTVNHCGERQYTVTEKGNHHLHVLTCLQAKRTKYCTPFRWLISQRAERAIE